MSDARECRNTTAPTISDACPTRPAGIAPIIQSRYSGWSRNGAINGVAKCTLALFLIRPLIDRSALAP
jgi:hypothetical protein